MLNRLPSSPSTRHMAQWESARLEAEARLSLESTLLNPPSKGRSEPDLFLRLWNSDVGKTFRKVNKGEEASQSPDSSSSTKCGSLSGMTTETGFLVADSSCPKSEQYDDTTECKSGKSCTGDVGSYSSDDLEDSSESALQLLFDFPCNNDMSFLGHTDFYSLYPFDHTEEGKGGFL